MRLDVLPFVRRIVGGVALVSALGAVVLAVSVLPGSDRTDAPMVTSWQPPVGYRLAETVTMPDDRRLRLWTGDSGWYVDAVRADRHEGAVGARGDGDRYSASEVLGGLLVRVPVDGARTLRVRADDTVEHGTVHAGTVLVPAPPVAVDTVLVTPLDAAGAPLAGTVAVAIAGRS